MKKATLLQKVLLLIFISTFSLNTNIGQTIYGYSDCPPALYNNHTQGYNFGRPITIGSATLVTDIGLCVGLTGDNSTILGIYSDNASSPNNLLAETALTPLVTGTNEMSLLSPIVLNPGTYWIVANHVGGTGPLVGNDGSSSTTLVYLEVDGGVSTLPTTISGGIISMGSALSFYVIGTPAAVCTDPSTLSISNITETSADLSWTENGTATTWDIEYGASGYVQGTGTTINDVMNPYTLTGLTDNTPYDYYVRADCGGLESAWVGPYSFMTAIICDPPANVQHALAGPAACYITWDNVPNATKYDINYRVKGTTTWTRIGALYNYRTLRYLAPNTIYQYRVRSYCDSWDFANATGFRQFNTANIPGAMRLGANDVETAIISMSPNPAQNVLNIQFSSSLASNAYFQIVDILGKSVYQKEVRGFEGLQNETIDVSSLGEGYYMVIMQCDDQQAVEKLVIAR